MIFLFMAHEKKLKSYILSDLKGQWLPYDILNVAQNNPES